MPAVPQLSNNKITRKFCYLTGCAKTMVSWCNGGHREMFSNSALASLLMCSHIFPRISSFLFSSVHSPFLFAYCVSKMWHYRGVAVCGAAYVEFVWKSWGLGALQCFFNDRHNSWGFGLATPNPQPVWPAPDSPRHCHSTPIFAV